MANMSATQVVAVLNDVFEENDDIVTALHMLAHSVAITRANARIGMAKAGLISAQQQHDAVVAAAEAERDAAEAALAQFVASLK